MYTWEQWLVSCPNIARKCAKQWQITERMFLSSLCQSCWIRRQVVFRANAGHVKQGLRCKHCRVNIHQSCGAKVLLDKVNFPWSLQSIKYKIKDIIDQMITSLIAMWCSISQVSVCYILYPRWVYASQRRKRGCSGEASPSTPRKRLGQVDHKMTSESCQEKYIELFGVYPKTLFFPVNGGGQGVCPLTQWKTHGICP